MTIMVIGLVHATTVSAGGGRSACAILRLHYVRTKTPSKDIYIDDLVVGFGGVGYILWCFWGTSWVGVISLDCLLISSILSNPIHWTAIVQLKLLLSLLCVTPREDRGYHLMEITSTQGQRRMESRILYIQWRDFIWDFSCLIRCCCQQTDKYICEMLEEWRLLTGGDNQLFRFVFLYRLEGIRADRYI